MQIQKKFGEPAALLFDVFGTVVDWRSPIVDLGANVTLRLGVDIDWGTFADDWRRDGYLIPIIEMFGGTREWVPFDQLHADHLDVLLERYGLTEIGEDDRQELLRVWRRLRPWPDSVRGLARLKARYAIGTLSNGGFALLTEMAKANGLPWDFIISAELFHVFKPSPAAYLGAARLLEKPPAELMLVAAHPGDLDAAKNVGMATAYVPRPLEWGPHAPFQPDTAPERFDFIAGDLEDLAVQLGA